MLIDYLSGHLLVVYFMLRFFYQTSCVDVIVLVHVVLIIFLLNSLSFPLKDHGFGEKCGHQSESRTNSPPTKFYYVRFHASTFSFSFRLKWHS